MRTKTLLLTAAIVAAGVAASQAQVYSVNAVGYVNKTVTPGYNLISNPLNGTNNNINTIIPVAPSGSVVLKWDSAAQQFAQADAYLDGVGWVDNDFELSTTSLNPGEGFFFQNNAGTTTLTFVGEVPQGNALTVNVGANYGFYSSIVPQSAGLSALGFPGQNGMTYNAWNPATQQYAQGFAYLDGVWYDNDFNEVSPTPAVGEGFLINNPGAAVPWTRSFNVN